MQKARKALCGLCFQELRSKTIDNRYFKKELAPYITPEAFHGYDLCTIP